MFKIICEKCNELELLFMLNLFVGIADFEQAILNDVYEMFPLCKVIGCWFHLSQQIQNLGPVTNYKSKKQKLENDLVMYLV